MSDPPTIIQMLPQWRHYVSLDIIFEQFQDFFTDAKAFNKLYPVSSWKETRGEVYNRKVWVPGSKCDYALSDAKKLCQYVLHPSRRLATQSAVLYHENELA